MTRLGTRRLNRASRSLTVMAGILCDPGPRLGAGQLGALEGAVGHVPLGEDAVVAAVLDDLPERVLEDRPELLVVLADADAVGARVDLVADDLEVAALAGDLGVVGGHREVGQGGVGPLELDLEDDLGAARKGAGLDAPGPAAGLLGLDQLLVDGAGLQGDGGPAQVGHGPHLLGVAPPDQDRGAGLEVLEEADLLGPFGRRRHRGDDQVELAVLERGDQLVEGGVDEGEAHPEPAAQLGGKVGVDAADLRLRLAHGPVEHVGGEGVEELHRGVGDVGADPDLPGRADPLGQAAAQVGQALGHGRGVTGGALVAGAGAAAGQHGHDQQRERGLTLGGLLAGRRAPGLREQRAATNRALAAYWDSAAGLDVDALAPAAADELASATNRLDGLTDLRQDVNQGSIAPAAALDVYNTTIADLLNTNRGLITGIADPQLAQRVGAIVAVSRIKELAALEREQVSEVLDKGSFAPGEFRRFTSTLSTRAVLLSEFRAAADDAQRATFVDTLVGPEVQRARELQAEAISSEDAPRLELDPAEWWTVNSTEIDLLRQVENQLGAAAVEASRADETAARTRAGLDAAAVLVVLALAIGLSLVVVRSLLRPLGLLRSSAEEVAHSQLPGVVERLQRAEPVDLTAETRPIGIPDRDEIGQVARAFDAVHSTAVRVAAEQAALRRSVADMFLSLGRRLQALVHRQLELLDELERTEADPQQLRSLFRLDHLATRMRRNAENLLVLSGAEAVRRWSDPVPLPRVIRAASAEIEDYNRVGVMPMADVRVVGHAVSDVVHLLAELIENAAAFSPPRTRVQVSGEPAAHGYLLEVEDQGIGMSDEELELANEQLAKPTTIDLASAQRLGFYVVGHLAARHGIKVRLRRSWFGGVAALVLLPSSLLGGPETEMEPAGAPGAGQPQVGPSPDGSGEAQRAAPADRGEPVPTPVPRAFAVRSPGAGRDNGMGG